MVYLPLSGMAPSILSSRRLPVSDEGRRQLRSATSRTCVVRRTYSNYGDRCFAAAGPKLWYRLLADLLQADISFQRFKRLLKTFLFGRWDRGALWLTVAPQKFLTDLLAVNTRHSHIVVETHGRRKRASICHASATTDDVVSDLTHRCTTTA